MRTPLQIVLIRDLQNDRTDVYAETLKLAFEGSARGAGSPSVYLGDAVDLGIRVLEPIADLTDKEFGRLLKGAKHTILVVIGNPERANGFRNKLDSHHIVQVNVPSCSDTGETQDKKVSDGVEHALAPVIIALRTMHKARRVLALETDKSKNSLKLFISHAKMDGVAMARSLIAMLKQLQGNKKEGLEFEYFYDHEHLKPGDVWREVLCSEAQQSVLIALRTEGYESRHWCRREFLEAECNGMPIIAVDLRKAQYHSSGLLPFDLTPTVRIHDGNIIRVLLHAMATHLRALRIKSQAPTGIKILPHRPSVYSLNGIIKAANGAKVTKIAYPGPKLSSAFRRAVEPILAQSEYQIELVTFDDLEEK